MFLANKRKSNLFLYNLHIQEAFGVPGKQTQYLAVSSQKDILKHLNALNNELREIGKIICDLIQSMSFFLPKLNNFANEIANQQFIHFLTARE